MSIKIIFETQIVTIIYFIFYRLWGKYGFLGIKNCINKPNFQKKCEKQIFTNAFFLLPFFLLGNQIKANFLKVIKQFPALGSFCQIAHNCVFVDGNPFWISIQNGQRLDKRRKQKSVSKGSFFFDVSALFCQQTYTCFSATLNGGFVGHCLSNKKRKSIFVG